jgi:uncharacterized damage-inducible protein DinB
MDFPEPMAVIGSRGEVFLRYLDFFRERVIEKVCELPEVELRGSRLPSGWSPLELVRHLTFVEFRWIEWGFEGAPVDDPWGDQQDGRWYVDPDKTAEQLVAALREQGAHTSRVVRSRDLAAAGRPGPRWGGQDPATLERVLFHLMQEYARHLGQLDVVAELAGGSTGE